jgi:alpha-L-rhamnosidase
VETASLGKDQITATIGPPVRRIEEIKPVQVIYTPSGDTLLDMGQNMVGWCRLIVNCPRGTVIKLRHGEVLDKYGNFYTKNLRTAKQTITYICKGGGHAELYEPRFTFQGFRYVSISGYPGKITPDLVTGVVIHSDMERTGHFSCNDSLVNRLYENILWTQKGNSVDLPTDCPQRDERLGWLGDAQLFAPTASYNMLVPGFYTKWLKDIAAEQQESGMVLSNIPTRGAGGGVAGWADAALIVPWHIYRHYGDSRILEEQYESMKAWVDYVHELTVSGEMYIWPPEKPIYGDWLAFKTEHRNDYPGATTDKDLLGTAYFYRSADLFQRTAQLLARTEDAGYYQEILNGIREAFVHEFLTPGGRLSSNTQTAYAMALSFGLLPDAMETVAAKRLADEVKRQSHITTGLLGTSVICPVLTDHGYVEEAYSLLFREKYPAWLYQVRMGGTTIWERWDGMKPDSTFQDSKMNSFNHPALGSVGDWLYRKVAGIDLDAKIPGFKVIVIKPYPGGKMNEVSACYESLYGLIRSNWVIRQGRIQLTVEIPVNTTAKIFVPSTGEWIKINGKPIGEPVKVQENIPGYHFLMVETGSGRYEFEGEFIN